MNNTLKNLKINKLINLFKYIILFVFGLIVLYLLISSVTSTALITFFFPPIENTFYEHDSILLHLFFFIIFTTALMFFRKVKINPKIININKVYILIFIFLIFFLMTANFQPKSDQSLVLKIADNMYGFNFSDFKKSGYMDIYPHQRGFVLLIFLFENIFGNYNFHAFQILNIFAFIIYCYCMLNIAKLIFPKDNLLKCSLLFLILFFPPALYVVFVYGNLIGLALSLLAVLYTLKYYVVKQKISNIILASVFISLAVLCKQNYLIFFTAIIIYLFINFLKENNFKSLGFIAIFITVQFFAGSCVNSFFTNYTKIELKDGAPTSSYIAMGLQGWDTLAPGWHNAYNTKTYKKNNCNTEEADKKAVEDIKKSLDYFKNNPGAMADFFQKKINSQWNNPTFQSFWIGQTSVEMLGQTNFSPLINDVYFGKTNLIFTEIANIVHTLILTGTLLFIIFKYKNIGFEQLILAITFIGGFIFHIFWEAKAQYTFSYFVLLIPYATVGYVTLTDKLTITLENYKNKKIKPKINKFYVSFAAVCFILAFLNAYSVSDLFFTKENTELSEQYNRKLKETSMIPHKKHIIVSGIKPDCYVSVKNTDSAVPDIVLTKNKANAREFLFTPRKTFYTVTDCLENKNFDVLNGKNGSMDTLSLFAQNNSQAQTFEIIPTNEESEYFYIIWNNEYAVTINENTNKLYIDKFAKANSQMWKFIAIN